MRRSIGVVVALVAVLGLASSAFGSIQYTLSNLYDVPGGPEAYGVGDVLVFASSFGEGSGVGPDILLNGVLTDLNSLVPGGSGWTLVGAYSVDDVNKQIVAAGFVGTGPVLPVLLTPAGDANENGAVDGADLSIWQRNYSPTGGPDNGFWTGDWNGDGRVDGSDLAIWQRNYCPLGLGYSLEMVDYEEPPEPIHGPEPTSMILLAASVGLVGRRIRKAYQRG